LVVDLDLVTVLNATVGHLHEQRLAYLRYGEIQGHLADNAHDQRNARAQRGEAIADVLRLEIPRLAALLRLLGSVLDESTLPAQRVHDGVAGVDAQRAGDALILHAIADIDAGRTHLHAITAVDTVTRTLDLA